LDLTMKLPLRTPIIIAVLWLILKVIYQCEFYLITYNLFCFRQYSSFHWQFGNRRRACLLSKEGSYNQSGHVNFNKYYRLSHISITILAASLYWIVAQISNSIVFNFSRTVGNILHVCQCHAKLTKFP
jgi:hypothetical protein